MRFGRCPNCSKYKYLKDGVCPSCKDDEWGVAVHHAFGEAPEIVKTGMTEEEAKNMVKNERWFTAVKVQ